MKKFNEKYRNVSMSVEIYEKARNISEKQKRSIRNYINYALEKQIEIDERKS